MNFINIKKMKLPIIIIVIGIVAAVAACMLTGIRKTPAVTEYDFNYSVTYKLNGEIKTLEGVYKCRFEGHGEGDNPLDRYYDGEYVVDGKTMESRTYTIEQKNGSEIYIVTLFNDSYLMGDTKNDYYAPFLEEPCLEALDKDGVPYEDDEMHRIFDAEIVSWEYPEPIENTFVFGGFSILHVGSMLAMLLVGILAIIACAVFVKRDESVSYKALDKISVVFNFIVGFAAIPFVTLLVWLFQLVMSGDEFLYQIFLCIPVFIAFTVAASIALRRKGFTKSGFFVQLVGPVSFVAYLVLESVISNLFF